MGDWDLILFFDGAEPGFYELVRCLPIIWLLLLMPWLPDDIRLLCCWTKPKEYGDGPPLGPCCIAPLLKSPYVLGLAGLFCAVPGLNPWLLLGFGPRLPWPLLYCLPELEIFFLPATICPLLLFILPIPWNGSMLNAVALTGPPYLNIPSCCWFNICEFANPWFYGWPRLELPTTCCDIIRLFCWGLFIPFEL